MNEQSIEKCSFRKANKWMLYFFATLYVWDSSLLKILLLKTAIIYPIQTQIWWCAQGVLAWMDCSHTLWPLQASWCRSSCLSDEIFFPPHYSTQDHFFMILTIPCPVFQLWPHTQEPWLENGFEVLSYPTLYYCFFFLPTSFTSQALLFSTRKNLKPKSMGKQQSNRNGAKNWGMLPSSSLGPICSDQLHAEIGFNCPWGLTCLIIPFCSCSFSFSHLK